MFFLFLIIVYRDGIVNVFFASLYGINIKIACRTNDILPYFNKKPIQSNFLAHRNKVSSKCRQKAFQRNFFVAIFTKQKSPSYLTGSDFVAERGGFEPPCRYSPATWFPILNYNKNIGKYW